MRLLITVLCLLITNWSSSQPFNAEIYITKKFNVAIFPELSKDIFPGDRRFTPTKDEIDLAEQALVEHLSDLNKEKLNQVNTPVIDKNLNKYLRQYFGYLDTDGKKILFINCFWKKENSEQQLWLKEMIKVHDGGSYYWNVKFNLETLELFDLEINGEA